MENDELTKLKYSFDNGTESSVICVLSKILDGVINHEFGMPREEIVEDGEEKKEFQFCLGDITEITAEWINYYVGNSPVFLRDSCLLLNVRDS